MLIQTQFGFDINPFMTATQYCLVEDLDTAADLNVLTYHQVCSKHFLKIFY